MPKLHVHVHLYDSAPQTALMQQQLDRLDAWSVDNMIMKLNPSKCQVMISCFHRTQMDVPVFHIGDSVIKQANCIKLLGILVQEDLKWNAQVGKYVYQIQHETLLSSHAQLFYSPSG